MGWLAAAIFGVVSLVSSIFGTKKASDNVKATNQAQSDLSDKQFEQNVDMWERQNVYNSPIEQQKRLIQAGLNPNLMYGQGTTGNASSAPEYNAPNLQAYTDFGDFGVSRAGQNLISGISSYTDIDKTKAEADLIRQNTKNLTTDNQLKELQVIYQMIQNSKGETENKYLEDLLKAKLANLDSTTINNFSSAQLKDSQRFLTDAQRERFNLLTPFVKDLAKTSLNQALYDLYKISPARLHNIEQSTAYQKVLEAITDKKKEYLLNQIEFQKEELPYKEKIAEFNQYMRDFQKEINDILKESGVNLKNPGMLGPLFYQIYRNIADPLGSGLDKVIDFIF